MNEVKTQKEDAYRVYVDGAYVGTRYSKEEARRFLFAQQVRKSARIELVTEIMRWAT